ncbi:hypothetical protein Vadar_009024 [Vaccinium darrowii]|uniref:Uncharacterized protein n=1 Tax=Vaccinium darrowii TaxID=229202 RepID=A0ACB7ZJD5_9ERIC|nr:hypothetical protein Vadar_009024 [Vaccinium darrowii]
MAPAIDFETEFPKTTSTYLSPQQRDQVFRKLKRVVVIVNTKLVEHDSKFYGGKHGKPRNSNDTDAMDRRGAGVILDKNGTILTTAYLVPDKLHSIHVRRENEGSWEAKAVVRNPKLDLAILVPKKKVYGYDFARLDSAESFHVGKEVLSIRHPLDLSYTSGIGQLACEDFRIFRDVRDNKKMASLRSEKLDDDLKLLQINNCHGSSSGAPVFNASGLVIGLTSFVSERFDFAVHLTVLRQFYKSYQDEKGEEMGKPSMKRKALSIS